MTFPDSTTIAPAYGFRLENQALAVSAGVLPRKGALLAQYDPSKTPVDNVPKLYLNKEQVGFELGWGFPAHRMAEAYFINGRGVPLWIVPVPEAGGATQRTLDITPVVTTAEAGTIHLYIGDEPYPCGVAANDANTVIADTIAAVINAEQNCPFTAVSALGVVTLTSKASGTFANGYKVELNYGSTDELPGGVTSVTIDNDVAGQTNPSMDDALAGMGEGSENNREYFTDCATSNGMDSTTLTACSDWNGLGNTYNGNYAPSVMRPSRFISVDTTSGTDGYDAMKVISDANTYDRTNCIVGAPGHKRHPEEMAAEILGAIASIAQSHPHQSYVGVPLQGTSAADATERWTTDDVVRDTANKAGIATTKVLDGTLVLDGMVTMYRPTIIAPQNNIYRSLRNIAITQNLSNAHRTIWEPNKNKTIVEDTASVNSSEKPYCMDIDGAKDLNNQWADEAEGFAWIYDSEFTKTTQEVTIRALANGFDHVLKVIYSAEGVISNTVVIGDISLAAIQG